jgi:magnesium transporter
VPKVRSKDQLDRAVLPLLRRGFVALRANQTVAVALEHLRRQNVGERVVYFYVVDEDDKLVGVLPTRRLLMGAAETRIDALMQRGVISVPHTASLLLVCELFVMHRLLAFPVVDDDGRLLGIVDVSLFTDEVFDLSRRELSNDVFQLIGVRLAQSRSLTPWVSFRQRFPWLICNVVGGIACALIAGLYETFLDSVIVLALFIPIVLTLAESVSVQSMTLTLQSMHQQRVDWRFLLRAAGQEFLAASMLGGGTGLVVGAVAYIWKSSGLVAIVIGGTIMLSVITACLLGVVLPAAVRALRGDPKIAAGPIVLALADVATLLVYFNLAGGLLR